MGDLYPVVPLDRYCFAPCAEQLTTGECDCTRRIQRWVKEVIDNTKGAGDRDS